MEAELEEKVRIMKVMLSIYRQTNDHDGTITVVGSDVNDLRDLLFEWLDNRNEELS